MSSSQRHRHKGAPSRVSFRSNRLKLDIAIRHQTPLAAGFYLAYRRPRSGQAGAWLARWKDVGDKVDKQSRLGDADDYTDADGIRILNYAQAQKKAEDWFKDLKAALNFAAAQRKTVGATPWREVKPFQKTASQRVRFLDVAEQRKLVASCDLDLRPLVMGALYTGVPLMFVAKQLGHADTRMCERHYGHIARQALSASIEKLSPKLGLFEPAVEPKPKAERKGRARRREAE